MSNEIEDEIWKTWPIIWYVQGSNLGRVRTLDRTVQSGTRTLFIKGRILAQRSNGKGYLRVDVNINGKKVTKYAHRVVAECFIPNPDNLPEINHKDNNPLNNNVSNIEWCTHEYNMQYKEKYGVSAKEAAQKFPVYAINLKTLEILRFESRQEASRQLGIAQESIGRVVKGKQKIAKGFWFVEDNGKSNKDKLRKIAIDMLLKDGIIAINLETQKVLWFKYQHDAGLSLGVNQSNISRVLTSKLKTAGGYWFCHADDNAVEDTRSKFGDEVANKVAKLMSEN